MFSLMRNKNVLDITIENACLSSIEELFFQLAQDYSKEEELPDTGKYMQVNLESNMSQYLNKKTLLSKFPLLTVTNSGLFQENMYPGLSFTDYTLFDLNQKDHG